MKILEFTRESVSGMTSDELRDALTQFKDPSTIGPITGSTRSVYEKLLLKYAGVEDNVGDGAGETEEFYDESDDSTDNNAESPASIRDGAGVASNSFGTPNDDEDERSYDNLLRARRRSLSRSAGDADVLDRGAGRAIRNPIPRGGRADEVLGAQDGDGGLTPVQGVLFVIFVIAVVFYIMIGFKSSQ